jgi:hypothetical protein
MFELEEVIPETKYICRKEKGVEFKKYKYVSLKRKKINVGANVHKTTLRDCLQIFRCSNCFWNDRRQLHWKISELVQKTIPITLTIYIVKKWVDESSWQEK